MVARAKAWTWFGIVGGLLLLPSGGIPSTAAGGEATVGWNANLGADWQICQSPTKPSRPQSALNDGIEAFRQGDYEGASRFFQQAQAGWNDLDPVQQQDLTRYNQANNTAWQQRREAADLVNQAVQADREGQTRALADLVQKALTNPYLAPVDRQRVQALADRLRIQPEAGVGGEPVALARAKVHQARQFLIQGNFDAAEQMAREAERQGVPPGADDTPRRILEDVKKARSDPKALLTAARLALKGGDLERAETLARKSEKLESVWSVHFFGDSPAKVLKDVEAARAKMGRAGASKTPDKETSSFGNPFKGLWAGPKTEKGTETGAKPTQTDAAKANRDIETARQFLQEGHKALKDGKYEQARDFAHKAETLKANLEWWDYTPAKLLADVQRAEEARGIKQPGRATASTSREGAKALLQKGREAYTAGKLTEALQYAQKAKAAPDASWGLFDFDTPDKLIHDINKVQSRRDQEEAAHLLVQGRQLLERGDLDGASKAAYRAETLHGPYGFWDLGDRPAKLLADIDNVRKRNRRVNVPPVPPLGGAVARTETENKNPTIKDSRIQQTGRAEMFPSSAAPNDKGSGTTLPPQGQSGVTQTLRPAAGPPTDQAHVLLAEARVLQRMGRLMEARTRALEAQRLPSTFGPEEDRPEMALIELAGLVRRHIDSLVGQADEQVKLGTRDPQAYARADWALGQAQTLARHFQLDSYTIDSKLDRVRKARGLGAVAVAGLPALPQVENQGEVVKVNVTDGGPQKQGRDMLDKARREIRAGDTGMARRLVEDIYKGPYGLQGEAEAMLRSIDAEEFEQKRRDSRRTFEAGRSAFLRRDYQHARVMLRSLDAKMLEPEQQARLRELLAVPEMQAASSSTAVAQVTPGTPNPAGDTPGKGRVGEESQETSFLKQVQAMQEVKFQKMRDKGLEIQEEAAKRFRSGDSERALEILQEYLSILPDAGLEPDRAGLLRRPVEARLQQYKTLKAQKDFASAQDKGRINALSSRSQKELAEQNKQKRIKELMAQYNALCKESKYSEAEMYAVQALDLDPDNETVAAAVNIARMRGRLIRYNAIKNGNEEMVLAGLNDAQEQGPVVSPREPLKIDKARLSLANKRGGILNKIGVQPSEKEQEILQRLMQPVNMNFTDMPLGRVLEDLSNWQGINIYPDTPALEEAGISLERPVTIKLENIALKSALNLLLHKVNLTYVIGDDVLKITTMKNARGKLEQRVFQVAELVIPVENNGPPAGPPGVPPTSSSPGMAPAMAFPGITPTAVNGSMTTSGTPVGTPGTGFPTGNATPSWTKPSASQTREDQLIQLITNTIRPESWAGMGGPGTIDYFPMTLTLVINQTPDVQEQVADLLAALRRLQDAEVAVEIRLISIAEGFYERIGLDFNINIKTDKHTQRWEPLITSGSFKPAGFINDFSPDRFIAGLTPAGTFTSDLDIPIRSSSFGMAIPPFGGFPNIPGGNGGIELGLAFLSDIQVFMFMEAAQGDQRTNVMQAPKLTMFNGQMASLYVADQQYFVLGVQVINNNGQITFVPQNSPMPTGGVSITIQAVISADRRFVRLNLGNISLTSLTSAVVPLFPVPVVVTPTFEGGYQGQPVVFTQFIQQPNFNYINVSTSVAVPDGGTVLLGGLKRLSEGRNEFGPPVLSKIPYLNRLFKNVGYGREVQNFMMMVTPRIIINEEEERIQAPVPETGPATLR